MKLLMKFHAAMLVLCRDEKPVQIEKRPAMRTHEVGPMGSSDKLRCAPAPGSGSGAVCSSGGVVPTSGSGSFRCQVLEGFCAQVRFRKLLVRKVSACAQLQPTHDQKRFLIAAAAVGIPSELFTALESPLASLSSIFFFF